MIGCVLFYFVGNCEYNIGNGFYLYFFSRGVGEVFMIVRLYVSR